MDLVKCQENDAPCDIDVESTCSEDNKLNNSPSEVKHENFDDRGLHNSTKLDFGTSQNAIDLRPRVTTRKDLFGKQDHETLKRPHSGSSVYEEASSSNESSLLALAKRFKVIRQKNTLKISIIMLLRYFHYKSNVIKILF